jgi:hypothetical protein
VLTIIEEVGQNRFKNGLPFFMRGDILPLWENHQNIRGGSYSIRGSAEHGPEYYKAYIVGAMTGVVTSNPEDQVTGVSISPKIMTGPNGAHRVGFYVIKVWNKDSTQFNKTTGIHLLHQALVPTDVLYTPHVEKKM